MKLLLLLYIIYIQRLKFFFFFFFFFLLKIFLQKLQNHFFHCHYIILFVFSEGQQKLVQLEELAKSSGRGKWSTDSSNDHIRNITWVIDNPRNFVDSHHNKPIDGKQV